MACFDTHTLKWVEASFWRREAEDAMREFSSRVTEIVRELYYRER
jgi:hypothetical protein